MPLNWVVIYSAKPKKEETEMPKNYIGFVNDNSGSMSSLAAKANKELLTGQ
jgi:hypothetical protein